MRLVTMLAGVLMAGGVLSAQDTEPISSSLNLIYGHYQLLLVEMAERMPEEDYSFKPVPEVRTFGELVGHVADHQAWSCSQTMGEQTDLNAEEEMSTKTELVAALKESFEICDAAHKVFTDANAAEIVTRHPRWGESSRFSYLMSDIGHSMEEYGYMAVYLRLKGIVPPSSDMEFRKNVLQPFFSRQ